MRLPIKVSANAKGTRFAGKMADGTLKFQVKAAPQGGAANSALLSFLTESLKIPRKSIHILQGEHNTRKLIELPDLPSLPW